MTPSELQQQVDDILATPAGTLTEEAEQLARAHEVLAEALNTD